MCRSLTELSRAASGGPLRVCTGLGMRSGLACVGLACACVCVVSRVVHGVHARVVVVEEGWRRAILRACEDSEAVRMAFSVFCLPQRTCA
jgi:hypothetical protein